MQNQKLHKNLEFLSKNIIDTTLVIGSLLGLLLYILSLINYNSVGFRISFVSDFFVIVILLLIAYYRKKLSINFKALIIILSLFLLVLTDTIELGTNSVNQVLLVLIPFYSLIYSLRKVIYIYVFAVLMFIGIGVLFNLGYIQPSIDLNSRNLLLNTWVLNILTITLVSFVIVITILRFQDEYHRLISRLEKKNNKLSEQELYFREIFNTTVNAIIVYSPNAEILDVNNTFLKMYGYTRDEVFKLDPVLLSYGDKDAIIEKRKKIAQLVKEKGQLSLEWKARKKDGIPFWVSVDLKKIKIRNNEYILSIIKDITQQKEDTIQLKLYRNHLKDLVKEKTKQLELANEELKMTNENLEQQKEEVVAAFEELKNIQQQLIQSEKLASLGLLAAGVAHEINNPLNFIQGGIYAAENYLSQNIESKHCENIKPLFEGIKEGVRRASDIVTGLNNYSRVDEELKQECDIHQIINNSLVMLKHQLKNKIIVNKNFTSENYVLIGSEGKLHQVFINIFQNAIHAIENKGIIDIFTEVNKEKKIILIKIKDNGAGISEQNLEKIFDPFFTTKEVGKGTGLGMSISLQIINEHNGEITYNSSKGKGTEVVISLPVTI